MSRALVEFGLRLVELRDDLALLEYTFELRPRINQVLDFQKRGEVLDLARKFASLTGSRSASFYGPMLVRLVASFERFLRSMIGETVENWAKKAETFDKLPEGLGERNLVLSGRFLASSDAPRDHLTVDLVTLVNNLASCRAGALDYRLNPGVFSAQISGVTPEAIESGLKAVRILNWWNAVGANTSLQSQLGSRRTVDASKQAQARLKELSRWRNNWAHGGDDEVTLTNAEVQSALEFLSAFSKALDAAVAAHLNRA
jgi:hypothetical protein